MSDNLFDSSQPSPDLVPSVCSNIHGTVKESHPCMGGQRHHHSLGLSEEHMGTSLTRVVFCSQMGQVSNVLSSLKLYLDD